MSAAWPAFWRPAARRPSRKARRFTGSAGTTSCRPPTQLLRRELLPEAEKALGIKMNFETVNAQRSAAAHHGGDPVGRRPRHLHAQQQSPAALCREPRRPGATWPSRSARPRAALCTLPSAVATAATNGCRCRSPSSAAMIAYRKSWFEEVGAAEVPGDLGEVPRGRQEAEGEGPADRPDARPHLRRRPTFTYPYMWSWGGKEVEQDGKTVNINSKETLESVKFMPAFWKDAHDEGGLAWDDTNNNRAFLSRTDLRDAERRLDLHRVAAQARTSTRPRRARSSRPTSCTRRCRRARPASSRCTPTTRTCMPSYSKNQKAAKNFLQVDAHQGELREVVRLAEGLRHAADARVGEAQGVGRGSGDGALQGRRQARPRRRAMPGPSNRKAAEVLSKYIITDMYAKAVRACRPRTPSSGPRPS